jgi:hypothetical protein
MEIHDALCRKSLRQVTGVELRMATRSRHRPDVGQGADLVRSEQSQKGGEGACGVPYRPHTRRVRGGYQPERPAEPGLEVLRLGYTVASLASVSAASRSPKSRNAMSP